MQDKVLLVVLSHNGLEISQKFYRHLFSHTDPKKLCMVWIDNGSTDGTAEWLDREVSQFDCLRILNTSNKGVIGGRNAGFDLFLKGDVDYPLSDRVKYEDCGMLMFLDNDQFVQPGWLEHHISVLDNGCDLVGIEAWQLSKSFVPVHKNTKVSEWYNYVGAGGMLMRREVVEKIGKFDEIFNPSYYEDPDYCFRAAEEGFKVGWNVNAKVVHLPHQTLGNAKDRNERFVRSLKAFREKWNNKPAPVFHQNKLPQFDL